MKQPYLALPAISVAQPVGEFFLCAIPAHVLIDVTYSIPATLKRESGIVSKILGTQRIKSEARAAQIGAYIDGDNSSFPNTIILSVNYRENGEYEDNEGLQWHALAESDGCAKLIIPSKAKLASIIDGQHRLMGYSKVQKAERMNMLLPCAVFMNLPRPYQARIFATININQKRVDKSLAYQLFGYDLNESDSNKWPPDMLGVYFARVLEGLGGSPFENRVRLALVEEERESNAAAAPKDWQVSVACLVEGITKLISARPADDQSALASGKVRDRSELPDDGTPLRHMYLRGEDKTLLNIVVDYFKVVERVIWAEQKPESFITRTVGILALFDILRETLKQREIDEASVTASSEAFFQNVKRIDFSNDFFHASGAGRVRIRKVIAALTGLSKVVDNDVQEVISQLKVQG